MSMIRWLHISDLHLGDEDMSSLRMRRKLIEFIRKSDNHFDYVFLTGDILTANKSGVFTPEMSGYIHEVCQACGISTDRMFIVAGNHDVNRDVEGRDEVIKRSLLTWGAYDPRRGVIDDKDFKIISSGQENFRQFLSELYPEERLRLYQNAQLPHFVVETADFNIVHLDTTVSYTKGHEAHDLIIGTSSLQKVLQKLNKKKPTILLTHYPCTALLQDERKQVKILLQENGVRLWLAGHEHDHNLQRLTYLDMLQAGELRYEEGATSSFIIVAYNPDTFKASARTYNWFDEGWAQYPFIDLDAEKKDVFEFILKPQNEDCISLLTKKARMANKSAMYRLTDKLDQSLFPKISCEFNSDDIRGILDESWDAGNNGIILLGDGGMGKSTMSLSFCKESLNPALYIAAERLASMNCGIEQYCIDTLFDGDESEYKKNLAIKNTKQSLIVVIDGLNEINSHDEGRFIREIQRINLKKGIQIVLTSRVDFTARYNLFGFTKAWVNDLDDSVLMSHLSDSEWVSLKDSATLKRLLKNPMLFTIYKEVCSVLEDSRDIDCLDWRLPIESASDLFYNFYVAQLALLIKRQGITGMKVLDAKVLISSILPAIAYQYEITHSINKKTEDFRTLLSGILEKFTVDENHLTSIRDFYVERESVTVNAGKVSDILISELHLMHREAGTTSFIHHMYRDYLSAQYIVDKSCERECILGLWNSRILPVPIGHHIRHSSGEYWNGLALRIKKVANAVTDSSIIIRNILKIFPSTNYGGVADYSTLNLCGHQLPNLQTFPLKVSLKDSQIDIASLGLDNEAPNIYKVLSISQNKQFLASASGTFIEIYNLITNGSPFRYDIGKRATQMVFFRNRLLINAGSIIIFIYDGGWRFSGEIKPESGSIFSSKFRKLVASDESLFLCYSNRILQYNLEDVVLTNRWNGPYNYDSIAVGSDLTSLKRSRNLKHSQYSFDSVVTSVEVDGMCATSYGNGAIILAIDGEVVNELGKRVVTLLDAALSGDGKFIATLSAECFGNKRRVQLWNVESKTKLYDFYCHKDIRKINLSENGNWILGVIGDCTWIYNLDSKEEWRSTDMFVSNQHGKFITFGDSILRRNENGGVELFNLATGAAVDKECPYTDASIVCSLNNGELAAVDKNGDYLKFKSIRDGEEIKIHQYGEKILAIQAFKSHPFIAVAASTGVISIYHTGTGQRTRKLESKYKNVTITAGHQGKTIFAHTDGRKQLTIEYLETKMDYGWERSWWRTYTFKNKLNSNILDLAFNEKTGCLIVILSNGQILYLKEDSCVLTYSSHIITSFDTETYDFKGVKCTPEIKEILHQNNCFVL